NRSAMATTRRWSIAESIRRLPSHRVRRFQKGRKSENTCLARSSAWLAVGHRDWHGCECPVAQLPHAWSAPPAKWQGQSRNSENITIMKALLLVGLLLLLMMFSGDMEAQSPTPTGIESRSVAQVISADAVKWVAARPGQDVSVLWGDPRTGPYGRFNRFAAGFEDRPHYHTRDLRVVIVSGTMIQRIGEAASQEVGPGSFILIPGGTAHTHSCKSGAPCVLFVQQEGPNDTVPVSK